MADSLTTKATAVAGMNALISAKAIQYYDKQKVFAGLIGAQNKYLVPPGAKSIDVLQLDTLSLTAQTEAVNKDLAETFATTARTLTPIVYTADVLTSWLKNDTTNNHMDQIAEAAGYALALAQDSGNNATSFSGTYLEATASTHELGANSTALTGALGRTGWQALMTSGARPPYNSVVDRSRLVN